MPKLSHIGIAVGDLPHVKRLYEILGLPIHHKEEVKEQGVWTHFIPLDGTNAAIELLEPSDPQGTIAQFIQKKGAGIHHFAIEFEKGELVAIIARLKQEGFRLVYEQPKKGAHGMMMNFIHPASTGGVLIEIMEKGSE